jgi:LmbE family N-acetylglucosaminyl deacetylase
MDSGGPALHHAGVLNLREGQAGASCEGASRAAACELHASATEVGDPGRFELYRLRERHYDRIYISPHLDDAVYSCGGQIAQHRANGRRVLVISVFGSGPIEPQREPVHVFRDAARRKLEELAAMEQLDCDFIFLDQPDALHRKHSVGQVVRFCFPFLRLVPGDLHGRMRAALEPLLARLLAPFGTVYFPFGVGSHPDHRLAFDLGRELHLAGFAPIEFYEDVAYVHVEGMLEERLRNLGVQAHVPFLRFARGVHRLTFKRSPRWHALAWGPLLFAFLSLRYALQRVTRIVDRRPEQGDPRVSERDISEHITAKVAAMRAYASQTEFFYPDPSALPKELARFGGRQVERSWAFPAPARKTALAPMTSAYANETRKVERLLREHEQGPALALAPAVLSRSDPQGSAARELEIAE